MHIDIRYANCEELLFRKLFCSNLPYPVTSKCFIEFFSSHQQLRHLFIANVTHPKPIRLLIQRLHSFLAYLLLVKALSKLNNSTEPFRSGVIIKKKLLFDELNTEWIDDVQIFFFYFLHKLECHNDIIQYVCVVFSMPFLQWLPRNE